MKLDIGPPKMKPSPLLVFLILFTSQVPSHDPFLFLHGPNFYVRFNSALSAPKELFLTQCHQPLPPGLLLHSAYSPALVKAPPLILTHIFWCSVKGGVGLWCTGILLVSSPGRNHYYGRTFMKGSDKGRCKSPELSSMLVTKLWSFGG